MANNEIIGKIELQGGQQANAQLESLQKNIEGFNKGLRSNYDATRLVDQLTGGMATKLRTLSGGFQASIKGAKGFNKGLKGTKKALIATGIGAFVVLLGTVVAYWDEIKEAINGVSKETKTLLGLQEKQVKASNDLYDNITGSANILKQQGKTEKEILQIKIKATDETIVALEAQLTTQKEIRKAQIDTAKRNKDILASILKMLSVPLFLLLETIDSVGKALGKDFGLSEGLYGGLASLIFDPEEIQTEGEESIKETEKQLLALKNRKAGFEINITKIEEQEFEKRQALKQAQYKIEFDAYKKHLEEMTQLTIDDIEKLGKIRADYNAKIIDQAVVDEQTRIDLDREKALLEIEELEINDALKGNARLAVNTYYDNLDKELRITNAQEKLDEELAYQQKKRQFAMDTLDNAARMAGEETKLGKALLLAKSLIAAKEFLISIGALKQKATVAQTEAVIEGTGAGVEIGGSVAKAANSAPPPINAFSIIAAITTGIGIMASIMSSVKATKSAASKAGGVGGGSTPTMTPIAAPSFNVVGQSDTNQLAETITGTKQEPIQAYVVSNDVTTAQGLERNIVEGATI